MCNASPHESVARCRKILRDALGGLSGEMAHTVVPVGHAHLDTAWLWPLREITRKKMAHTTATQLGLLERYPEYVFAHSQASQYEWLEQDYPELFERVKAAIRGGRWEVVGSMWVEADCNLTGAESLVRQFLYGRRYFREKLGVETHDMWLPDVFGYSAALPQILAKFNIPHFLTQKISWNQFNKFPHHTFWWQGIDGTKVWSHFPPADSYNGTAEPKEVVFSVKNFKDHGRSDASLYLFGWGDGGGGPTERHLEFLRRGRNAPNYPEVASGRRALDFFRDAKARSKDLLTWTGELYLELHRGTYTSQAANKKANRECEFLLRDAEILSAFDPGFPASYPQRELEARVEARPPEPVPRHHSRILRARGVRGLRARLRDDPRGGRGDRRVSAARHRRAARHRGHGAARRPLPERDPPDPGLDPLARRRARPREPRLRRGEPAHAARRGVRRAQAALPHPPRRPRLGRRRRPLRRARPPPPGPASRPSVAASRTT